MDMIRHDTHWAYYTGTGKNRKHHVDHLVIYSPVQLDAKDINDIRKGIDIKDCPVSHLLMSCEGHLRNFFTPKYFGVKMSGWNPDNEAHHILVLHPNHA